MSLTEKYKKSIKYKKTNINLSAINDKNSIKNICRNIHQNVISKSRLNHIGFQCRRSGVRVLARSWRLYPWSRYSNTNVSLFIQEYEWVPAKVREVKPATD